MAITDFRPVAGNFGEEYITSTRTLPATVLSASATIRHYMPLVAADVTLANNTEILYYKGGALVFGGTASSTAGTVTARVVKRNSGGTITALSSTVTIPSGTTVGAILAFPVLTTATASTKTIRPNAGDTIAIEFTCSSTVSTQPGDVQAAVKLCVLR